jgi:phosphocarrier protein HPr
MPARELSIANDVGLHARPAAVFCKRAAGYEAVVVVVKDGEEANAKSLLSVLKLDVRQGDTVVVRADGPDADRALDELEQTVASL